MAEHELNKGAFRTGPGIVTVVEAEHHVKALEQFMVHQVGTDKWLRQHELIEQLNIQAHHNALTKHDEFVVELLFSHDKVSTLIHELVVIELWKEQVFPLLKAQIKDLSSVKTYMILYHETVLCNFLEVVFFHEAALPSAGDDALLELVDYCARKLVALNAGVFRSQKEEEDVKKFVEETTQQALARQSFDIGFSCACSAVGLLRLVSDHCSTLPLPVLTRMLTTNDVILHLIPLLEAPPWVRKDLKSKKLEKFIDQKWIAVAAGDALRLSKLEAQVWLCVYNLLMSNECRAKYHFTTYRKDIVLKLKKFFHEVLLDQIPGLDALQRYLEELSLMEPPKPTDKSFLVIEQVPEIRESILKTTDWKELAALTLTTVLADDEPARRRELQRLSKTYNIENFEEVMDDPLCEACGKIASQRCSRCKNSWYCSRSCQVGAWKAHKNLCDVIAAAEKKAATVLQQARQDQTDKVQLNNKKRNKLQGTSESSSGNKEEVQEEEEEEDAVVIEETETGVTGSSDSTPHRNSARCKIVEIASDDENQDTEKS